MRKTIVYVDGFNLYYALKRHKAKWLNLEELCRRLLTENDVVAIKYFTARVKSRIGDLDVDVRQVIKTEEKGSDVNIATLLLVDGFQGKYDAAAVITNDSDLKLPISMVKNVLKKTVGVICPHERPSKELIRSASFFKTIKPETFLECQFPDPVHVDGRKIHKPKAWN